MTTKKKTRKKVVKREKLAAKADPSTKKTRKKVSKRTRPVEEKASKARAKDTGFRAFVDQWRKKAGKAEGLSEPLSVREVIRRTGLDVAHFYKLLGDAHTPRETTLQRIADGMDVTVRTVKRAFASGG